MDDPFWHVAQSAPEGPIYSSKSPPVTFQLQGWRRSPRTRPVTANWLGGVTCLFTGGPGCGILVPQMMASGPPTGAIRVLLADGDRLLARDLMRTLSAEERFDIVGCAHDGMEAVELATSLLPDVVLMGLEMPALDAVEATRRIRARVPSARVLIMGSFDEPGDVDLALAAEAAGFVRRSCTSAELVATIFGLALVFAFDPTAVAPGGPEPPVSAGARFLT